MTTETAINNLHEAGEHFIKAFFNVAESSSAPVMAEVMTLMVSETALANTAPEIFADAVHAIAKVLIASHLTGQEGVTLQ